MNIPYHFGQPQKIVNAHTKALLNIRTSATQFIVKSLIVNDSIENHIKELSPLGKTKKLYGALLVPLFLVNYL